MIIFFPKKLVDYDIFERIHSFCSELRTKKEIASFIGLDS